MPPSCENAPFVGLCTGALVYAADGATLLRRLRMTKNAITPASSAAPPTPPTTPPTMGPTLLFLLEEPDTGAPLSVCAGGAVPEEKPMEVELVEVGAAGAVDSGGS